MFLAFSEYTSEYTSEYISVKKNQLAAEMMISVTTRNMEELNWVLENEIPLNEMIAFTGTKLSSLEFSLTLENTPNNVGTLGNFSRPLEVYKTFYP
ncbi:hypothetical protein [Candidatus Ornithobacterium hominis]|uniref:hypothetical protein n=1 Tax=Candidatus Ornithobacterium hominis TaxID=2497989 RepID=UPI001058744E|nr:hypothetical protein [Candidatus Ornithobacterium hominis]